MYIYVACVYSYLAKLAVSIKRCRNKDHNGPFEKPPPRPVRRRNSHFPSARVVQLASFSARHPLQQVSPHFCPPPTASLCGDFLGDTPWLPLFWDKAMMVRKRRTFKKSLVIHRIEMLDISTQRRFVSCRFRRIFQSVKSKGQRPATQIYLQSPCRVTWQSIQSETHWGLETFGLVDITPLESTPKTPFFQNKKGCPEVLWIFRAARKWALRWRNFPWLHPPKGWWEKNPSQGCLMAPLTF